jgi:hypothetical protein
MDCAIDERTTHQRPRQKAEYGQCHAGQLRNATGRTRHDWYSTPGPHQLIYSRRAQHDPDVNHCPATKWDKDLMAVQVD